METRGEPFLEVDGMRIDSRDIEALRGIDEHGSMHKAATELGRSYSRIQQRVVELEDAVGSLVTRERGGKDGGGSTLTENAHNLISRFDRLRAEFAGLARTEETVFSGTVTERSGMLGTVETAAGSVRAIVPKDVETAQVSVRSDAVALTSPDDVPDPTGTSVRNQFCGTVAHIETEGDLGRVTIDVDAETPLRALVTQTSLDALDLEEGDVVTASFKATATRAIPDPPE